MAVLKSTIIWSIKRIIRALTFYIYSSLISKIPFYFIRHQYLRQVLGIIIGRGSSIQMGVRIQGANIAIGDRTVVNYQASLDGRFKIDIGQDCSISSEACILSLSHELDSPDFSPKGGAVRIEDRVWIGTRAIILPGVHLGEGCVVGAGSVVTRSFPPYSVVAGVPARMIKMRQNNLTYRLKYFPLFDSDITLDPPK